jgi:hypothetical protein
LASLAAAVCLFKDSVPWDKVRALPARIKLPRLVLLATATFTPIPAADATPSLPRPSPTQVQEQTPARALVFVEPRLLEPDDKARFDGNDSAIELRWEAVGPLEKNEWYEVSLRFSVDSTMEHRSALTKDTSWTVPLELHTEGGQGEAEFQWDVTVIRHLGTEREGTREGVRLSYTSDTRTFFWR